MSCITFTHAAIPHNEVSPACTDYKQVSMDFLRSNSIPDAPRAVMRNALNTLRLHIFHCVVEKEVYEDGINLCFWILADDLAPQKLNTPDAAPPKLHLPGMATFDERESAYPRF